MDAAGTLPEDSSGRHHWLVLEVPRLVEYKVIERWAQENAAQLWFEALTIYLSTPEEERTALHHVPTSLRALQFATNERYEERHEGMREAALWLTQLMKAPAGLIDLMLKAGIYAPRLAPDGIPDDIVVAEAGASALRDKAAQGALARELHRIGWQKRDTSVRGEKGIWWFPPPTGEADTSDPG